MTTPLSKKIGIQEGMRIIFINAPADAIKAVDPPSLDVASKLNGCYDYIHLFTKSQTELENIFSKLKDHLKQNGMLWVSWPKHGQLGTNLTLAKIINIGYGFGLVESKCLSIDTTWSGLKFTNPKKGKVYHNSYGHLKP